MTAWTVLVGNSTLPDNGVNTAWDHLNNQTGGGGGGTVLLIGPSVMDVGSILSANVNTPVFGVSITEVLTVNIDSAILGADISTVQTINVD